MQGPLEIVFDNLDRSPSVEAIIKEKCKKLERFYQHMTDARVVVSQKGRRHHKGNDYSVTIEANVPGKRLVVSKSPGRRILGNEELLPTVNDAFKAMIRQLEDYARKQRGDIKFHETPLEGRVSRIYPYEGYGYISLTDGREVYFHRNSVVDEGFEPLKEGAYVRVVLAYDESPAGPQATTVQEIRESQFLDEPSKQVRGNI